MSRTHIGWVLAGIAIGGVLLARLVLDGDPEDPLLRYRHPITKGESLETGIAFLEDRVATRPMEGLDLAHLADLYLEAARRTGEESWIDKAEDAAKRSLANLSVSNAGAKLALARVANARHEFEEAVRIADEVIAESAAAEAEARTVRATARLALGRLPAALADAEHVAARAPLIGALSLRGTILEAMGRDEEALEDWRTALAREETGQVAASAWVRAVMGRWYLRHGRLRDARAWLEEARRLAPGQPIALLALAELESREGDVAAAASLCENGFNRTKDPTFLARLGVVKQRAGDRAGAATAFAKAEALLREELASGRTGHRVELARVLLARGDEASVREAAALTRAEVERRRSAEVLGVHAWALAANGDGEGARAAIREALASGVRSAELYVRAADAEAAAGNRDRARFYRDLAAKTDPTLPELGPTSLKPRPLLSFENRPV